MAIFAHDNYKEKKESKWFARASAEPGASHASPGLGRDKVVSEQIVSLGVHKAVPSRVSLMGVLCATFIIERL